MYNFKRSAENKKLQSENETLRQDREILFTSSMGDAVGPAASGVAAKKIIELGKKVRQMNTEIESEKTKARNLEKKLRETKNQNEQLKARLKKADIELNSAGDDNSSFGLDALARRYETQLKEHQKNEKHFHTQIEQLQLEIKSQKKVLEAELGENMDTDFK